MPISKITAPSETPSALSDYQAQNALLSALLLAVQGAERIVGSNVVKGAVFQVGGATYLATADTAISGSASDYVKLTVSVDGLSLAPSYVADLTGVTWSSTYNGYYDVNGNLYIFDELKAYAAGTIVAKKLAAVGLKNVGAGWEDALIVALGTGWPTTLSKAIIDFAVGSAGTYGTQSILSGATWTIPAGMYMITSDNIGVALQVKDGSTNWYGAGSLTGIVISDGTNYRASNGTGGSRTIYYRKLL